MPYTPLEYTALPAANVGHVLPFEPVRHAGVGHLSAIQAPGVRLAHQHSFADLPGMMRMHSNMVYTGPQKDEKGQDMPDPKPAPVVRAPALNRTFSHKLLETPYFTGHRSPAVAAGYASSNPMN